MLTSWAGHLISDQSQLSVHELTYSFFSPFSLCYWFRDCPTWIQANIRNQLREPYSTIAIHLPRWERWFCFHAELSAFLLRNSSRRVFQNVLGSASLYRALLERCWKRKMAMICRFCSRVNQKVRLVALVPHMSEKSEVFLLFFVFWNFANLQAFILQNRSDAIRDYDFDGFHVVFLPFAEDIRDVSEKMKCPQGDWPKRGFLEFPGIIINVNRES